MILAVVVVPAATVAATIVATAPTTAITTTAAVGVLRFESLCNLFSGDFGSFELYRFRVLIHTKKRSFALVLHNGELPHVRVRRT